MLSKRLKSDWPALRAVSIPSCLHEINPLLLAQDLESEAFRRRLAGLIRPHGKDVEFIGLAAADVVHDFSELLGKPVFEIPAMPPSIPGIRLKETFLRILPAK